VLHHVTNRPAWLERLFTKMGTGARLVLIEFKEGDLPEGPPKSIKLPREEVTGLVTKAGFVKVAENSELLPYQYVLTFENP
jgi:hypothetical protein